MAILCASLSKWSSIDSLFIRGYDLHAFALIEPSQPSFRYAYSTAIDLFVSKPSDTQLYI